MRILALEPYYGGSHRAFLDGWRRHSAHDWAILGLPGYKWKWRMRHGAITLAGEAAQLEGSFDLILCSDMLNLAEFRGLAGERIRALPPVAYFHENQLTYPAISPQERDYHFALSNLTTALAADAVWFNSEFHRRTFLDEMRAFLGRMPDYQPMEAVESVRAKSSVQPQGIEPMPSRPTGRREGPLRILWAARWEHDKNPEDFFAALTRLKDNGALFRISVIGERFAESPSIFEEARAILHDRIDRWGYQESREAYVAALADADIVVSTAIHEFFGVSMVEAIAAGAYPLLPDRLAYPEILGGDRTVEHFYDGTVDSLTDRLHRLMERFETTGSVWDGERDRLARLMDRFTWPKLAPELDAALAAIAAAHR